MTKRLRSETGAAIAEVAVVVGIIGILFGGILLLVRDSGSSAQSTMSAATMNAEMRETMEVIQSHLALADKPMMPVLEGVGNPTTNDLVITRTHRSNVGNRYHAYRIFLNPTGAQGPQVELWTLPIDHTNASHVTSTGISDAYLESLKTRSGVGSPWNSAARKVLIKNVRLAGNERLFTFYSFSGTLAQVNNAAPPQITSPVSLADVTLRSAIDANDRPQIMRTSVYLRKIADRYTGRSAPVTC